MPGSAHEIGSSSPATGDGLEWSEYTDLVNRIVNLLGGHSQAGEWGNSVKSPFAPFWTQELSGAQFDLYRRLLIVQTQTEREPEEVGHSLKFLYSGHVLPLQALIDGIALSDACKRSPEMEAAKRSFQHHARQYIINTVVQLCRQSALRISENEQYLTFFNRCYNEGKQYWPNEDSVNVISPSDLHDAINHYWPQLTHEQQLCAIGLFKLLKPIFREMHTKRLVQGKFFGLWVPTYHDFLEATQALHNLEPIVDPRSTLRSSTHASLSHGAFNLTGRKKMVYGFT